MISLSLFCIDRTILPATEDNFPESYVIDATKKGKEQRRQKHWPWL